MIGLTVLLIGQNVFQDPAVAFPVWARALFIFLVIIFFGVMTHRSFIKFDRGQDPDRKQIFAVGGGLFGVMVMVQEVFYSPLADSVPLYARIISAILQALFFYYTMGWGFRKFAKPSVTPSEKPLIKRKAPEKQEAAN